MLSFVLLLLFIRGAEAAFHGVVYSFYIGDLQSGLYPFILEYRLSFSSCEEFDSWFCRGNCSGQPVYLIDESRGEWCQKEYAESSSLSPSYLTIFNSRFSATSWTANRNAIGSSIFTWHFDLRNRSDINKPGSPPQTTIIPLIRVPSNCQRNINLLVSDPDGDDVRCRYAAGSECFTCTPPSVLNVSSSCSLSFSPTNSSDEGPYAVQMMVEDFPRQNITLTDTRTGVQSAITPSHFMNQISLQFVFRVDPAAPSCTEGEYLPRFLPPTPEHGAQFYTVSQAVEIIIRAEATQAKITGLLFSGPAGVTKSSSGSGNFTLTWTPPAIYRGLTKTLCFVVQANSSGSVYQSDLRCVFVTAEGSPTTTVATPFTPNITTTPLFTFTPPPATPPPATPPPATPPPTTPPPATPPPDTPPPDTPPPATPPPDTPPPDTPPPDTPPPTTPPPTTPPPTTPPPDTPEPITEPSLCILDSTPDPGRYYVLALNLMISAPLTLILCQ